MIFDAHMHPFPNFFSSVSLPLPGSDLSTPDRLVEIMRALDMAGALLLGPDTDALIDYIGAVPHAYGLAWTSPSRLRPPSGTPTVEERMDVLLRTQPKIVGLKLHPLVDSFDPSSRSVDGLYEVAAAHDAPVLLHTGHEFYALPWLVGAAARRHPRTTFVMGHMGLTTLAFVDAAIEVAEELPNVFLEISGMPFTWKIPEAVRRVGRERVLYGSDAPFFTPQIELEKVRMSGLTEPELDRVLGANAVDLFLHGADLGRPDEHVRPR